MRMAAGATNGATGTPRSELNTEQRLTEALDATQRGRVFLLAPRCKVPRAGDKGYQRNATRNGTEIATALACNPDANVGVIPVPGLFVLDDDGGLDAWEHASTLPPTPTVITGSGGRHRWFALPPERRGWRVKGKAGVRDLVDIIGSEGAPQYVVTVGSIHPDTGNLYQWAPGCTPADVPIATAPPELVALLDAAGVLLAPHVVEVATTAAAAPDALDPVALVTAALLARPGSKQAGDEIEFPCVYPERHRNADTKPSAHFNTEKRCFHCKACGATGGLHKLAAVLGIVLPDTGADRTPDATATKLAALALHWHWSRPGAGGAAGRSVLLFLLDIARRTGELQVSASVRRIAEAVGIDKRSVLRVLPILRHAGWLRTIGTTDHGTSCYLLTRPQHAQNVTSTFSERKRQLLLVTNCAHHSDATRRGSGLGTNTALVLAALDTKHTFATGAELGRTIGINPSTARRTLAAFARHGLAIHDMTGWRRGPAELAAVAATLPTAGALERQRQRHADDREHFARWKAAASERQRNWLAVKWAATAQWRQSRRRRQQLRHPPPPQMRMQC